MIINTSEKVHVMYRATYENSVRRHFIGEVIAAEGAKCRLEGFVFIYDQKANDFVRKQKSRTTIIDLADSGCIVNIIDSEVNLDDIVYTYKSGEGVVVTDNKNFTMNINEYNQNS